MANATLSPSLTSQVSEERLGALREVADRFEQEENIKLYQFHDPSQLIEYLQQRNYTNDDIIEAYHAFVEGDTGTQEPEDHGQPDYPRQRARWEYALQHKIKGHEYEPDELEQQADKWINELGKSYNQKKRDSTEKTLADVTTYAEFKELRARNPKIPERAWIHRQHHNAYQWQKLIRTYRDTGPNAKDSPEIQATWKQDLTKIGLSSLNSKDEFDRWRIANKITNLPDEVWEHRADYKNYADADFWRRLNIRYAPRKLPWRLSREQQDEWKNSPRNKGLANLTTDEEFQAIVNDYNQDISEKKDEIDFTKLKALKQTAEDWDNPEDAYTRLQAQTKAELTEKTTIPAPPPARPELETEGTIYAPPEHAPFNNRHSGETSEEIMSAEEIAEATEALNLSEDLETPLVIDEPLEEEKPEDDQRSSGGGPSMPSDRQLRMVDNLTKGSGGVGTGTGVGAGGVGAAGTTGIVAEGAVAVPAAGGGLSVGAMIAIGVAVIAAIALLIILGVILFGGQKEQTGNAVFSFNKSGPAAVGNGEEITYTIAASYGGNATDIIVQDQPPEGTEVVEEKTTQPHTYDAATRTVTWSLSALSNTNASSSATTTSYQKYTKAPYNFPDPNGTSDVQYTPEMLTKLNDLGKRVANHQKYILSLVNQDPQLSDPFLSVIWSGAIEGIYGNNYSWNCQDKDHNINNGCAGGFTSGGWQVGNGIQVSQAVTHLENDFNEAYGVGSANDSGKVHQVGQQVIESSSSIPQGKITNPSSFPVQTVSELIAQARSGNVAAQQAIAILLMDPEIGSISIAIEIAGDINASRDWVGTMQRWSDYYGSHMQQFSNRMKTLSESYTGTSSSLAREVMITLRPTKENTYVINIAKGQVLGGTGTIPTGGGAAPNAENCQGKYLLNNAIGKNFGDPNCNFTNDDLGKSLQSQDPTNAVKWYEIAKCESGYAPNAYRAHHIEGKDDTPDPQGAWGLFQMGSSLSGPGTPGKGLNGQYDRGDVDWPQQISNAIAYSKTAMSGQPLGAYWQCAR